MSDSDINAKTFDSIISTKTLLVLVYSMRCGHCIHYLDNWNTFYSNLTPYEKQHVVSIEIPEVYNTTSSVKYNNKNMQFKHLFTHVPSIVTIDKKKHIKRYEPSDNLNHILQQSTRKKLKSKSKSKSKTKSKAKTKTKRKNKKN